MKDSDSSIDTPEIEVPQKMKVAKSVRFFNTVCVVLIPHVKEYHAADIASDLWWSDIEKEQIKEEALYEIHNYMNQLDIIGRDNKRNFITRDGQMLSYKQILNRLYDNNNLHNAELIEPESESTELDDERLYYVDLNDKKYDAEEGDEEFEDEELKDDEEKNSELENTHLNDEFDEKPNSCSMS